MNLYPPILESQRASMQQGSPISTDVFEIPFTMPLATALADIKHVQVLIRRQINMEPWSEQGRTVVSPDREIIYLNRDAVKGKDSSGYITALHATNPLLDVPQEVYYVVVPGAALRGPFSAGTDSKGETYTIQIRFGENPLTYNNVSDFAIWRQNQTISSSFGEWSNTQRMFVHGGAVVNIAEHQSPIAGLGWDYIPVSNDPLSQVRISYSWSTPNDDAYGNMFRSQNLDFASHDGMGARASGSFDMGVMRFAKLTISLVLTTINNTVITKIVIIDTWDFERAFPTGLPDAYIYQVEILGEEVDDGVIGVGFGWPNTTANRVYYHNIYRINLRTLETVLITQIPIQNTHPNDNFDTILKDYSVEMGEEYIYFGAAFNLANEYQYALEWDTTLNPDTWKPHLYTGYARQMNFQGNTFLTTKWGQLRLQGNVQVSNFQRNTSDQFTTTIGGLYPFYSRSAQFNYRTLSLQGLVSMNFDSTNTFLRFRTQMATPGMVAAENGAKNRYNDAINSISDNDPQRNQKRDAVLGQYYREMEMIYRGINPTTGKPFPDLTDRPLWMTGQLWLRKDQDNESLVLRDTELFSNYQFSNSQSRTQDKLDPSNERFERADFDSSDPTDVNRNNTNRRRGPTSIYDRRKIIDATRVQESDRASDLIYAERKFREAVMIWLSDGKPKLFRSETEGNMIVMLSGINFTPFNKSRHLYSLSCTVTEIAEYNLSNLMLYGLIPVKFESFLPPAGEYEVIYGDIDPSI